MLIRFLAALLLSAAAGHASAEPPKPLLWKVSDADNAVYLLGSFHLLRPDDYPLSPAVYAALDDAENVVFELSPEEMNDPSLGQKMMRVAQRADGRTLQAALPAETWTRLSDYAARRNLPIERYQGFDTWFMGLLIGITEMQGLDMDPALGLDRHVAARAVAAGKAVGALETAEQQFAMFDGLSPEEQLQSLQDSLDDIDSIEQEISRMHALWRAGDATALYAMSGAEMKRDYPALYERMNVARNRAWLPEIRTLLDAGGRDDALVVVGAMHLLGEDGVVRMLRDAGYTVERL
ncbi:MAG TPA: TraB/GumN family protein [Arenimonas sp.]|uniref:TraB/GumN family protein n=1 Tax=Arenimonas sp. TaxID=1872635 RepID=UPI002D804678|nr:TraB/GumN family protein [Arenimonas sp.]HEU0152621.1 TraB/GumN family protein [Arenimonas sp.]